MKTVNLWIGPIKICLKDPSFLMPRISLAPQKGIVKMKIRFVVNLLQIRPDSNGYNFDVLKTKLRHRKASHRYCFGGCIETK